MGQTNSQAKYIARGAGYTLFLAKTEAVFGLKTTGTTVAAPSESRGARAARTDTTTDHLRMRFAGANPSPAVVGEAEAITKSNYFRGRSRLESVPNFARVSYRNLYDGVDAVFYGGENGQLEYDFVVAPNADAAQIRLNFEGADSVSVDRDGNLVIKTDHAELLQQAPVTYQMINGARTVVASRYVVTGPQQVQFELGAYDQGQTLTIDPRIGFLTYLGGNGIDRIDSLKLDPTGNAVVVGATSSTDFPVPNSHSSSTGFAVFVTKIAANGQSILFNTFLDGSDDDGITGFSIGYNGSDVAIDPAGNIYVAGVTNSNDFPTTSNAYQTVRLCSRQFGACIFPEEAFVTKLNSAGAIVYSTLLGGRHSDFANGIAVDASGRAYVVGETGSGLTFPEKNEFQGSGVFSDDGNGFLTVFNSDGSDITYSTAIGGNESATCNAIALDAANNAFIAGETAATSNFPIKNAFQSTNRGGIDGFIARVNPAASGDASLIYSTYLGGSGTDRVTGIAVDADSHAIVTGVTGSANFPLQNAFRSTNQVNEAFVTELDANGSSLANSSFLGGSGQEVGNKVELGPNGAIYVTGKTTSVDFPISLPFQANKATGNDAFITKLRFGIGVISSSYLGGNGEDVGTGLDLRGKTIVLAGSTGSNNLPTTSGVLKPTSTATNSNTDGFISRILDTQVDSVGVFRPTSTFLLTQSTTNVVSQTANSTGQLAGQKGVAGDWDGDGIDTIGSFNNGVWKYRNANFPLIVLPPPFGAITVNFGSTGDLPVVGDWNGDGIDTPGIFRSSTGQFIVTDSTDLNPSITLKVTKVNFGLAGDIPIAGDWDGDGKDSVAVYRPSAGQTFFTNADISVKTFGAVTLSPGVDITAFLGVAEDLPTAGDWNGDGIDSLGLWRPSTGQFFLTNDNANLLPTFIFGQTGDQPIAGDWDGRPNP